MKKKHLGFTLIELLVVVAVICILAAIIFPVFGSVRERGRQITCLSNLRQIGQAFSMYAQDNDEKFALGADALDQQPGAWDGTSYENEVKFLKPLTEVLFPFTHSKQIWECPSDTGFDMTGPGESIPFRAHPSSFEQHGTSYYYHTSLALDQRRMSTITAWNMPSHEEYNSSEIAYLYDGSSHWHGGRYDVLYVDGHVKNISRDMFDLQWHLTFVHP